jgi:hypothetical protein
MDLFAQFIWGEIKPRGEPYAVRLVSFLIPLYEKYPRIKIGEATIATAVANTRIWFRVPMMSICFPFLFSIILV